MSATFHRRLMRHCSFRAFYLSLRSIWQTGLKLKTNSTAIKFSSLAFHWNFDNKRITFEWRTNKRHPSGVSHISLKSTICTAPQLENHASLPRGSSSDEYDSESFIRNHCTKPFEQNFTEVSYWTMCTKPFFPFIKKKFHTEPFFYET